MPKTYFFDSVSSTMDVLFHLLEKDKLPVWDNVLASMQTEGRGQARKNWCSESGNIFASLRLPDEPPFSKMGAAVAFSTLLMQALHDCGYPVFLKWTNDLVIEASGHDLKIAGILIEERKRYIIAGVGINLHHSPAVPVRDNAESLNPGNLAQTGRPVPDAQTLWNDLVNRMLQIYSSSQNFSILWQDLANKYLLWKGEEIIWHDGKARMQGKLAGIGNNGALLMRTQDGQVEFTSGSIYKVSQ